LEANGRDTSEVRDWLFRYGVQLPQNAQPTYRRRANNQVSAEVEALICELIGKKWSKSAIAKRLKVNRRVVIRVAREFQSAQSTKNKPLIDLGKN
jgi:transposase